MKKRHFEIDQALAHPDHHKPRSRRDFIAQGFAAGAASVLGAPWLANPAMAALSPDVLNGENGANCQLEYGGANKIPFICFDLAGGANIAGSNVLVGGPGGQKDFLSASGYSKQGLPGDMVPSVVNPATDTNDFVNDDLGLAFHADSQFLAGIMEKTSEATRELINGAVIAARSENDTGNNPHNPMYGIYKAGAAGALLPLCGSSSSVSGGNSMAPASMIDPSARPTKVDRPTDVTGLVDTGGLVGLLSKDDTVSVMEAMYRISHEKLSAVETQRVRDDIIKQHVRCSYAKSADIVSQFGGIDLSPLSDPEIVGDEGIFSAADMADREFRKTASVMKLVLDGPLQSNGVAGAYAGAGTITMGGYDYHTGDRATGESRDLRAGRCMGAVLEYAAKKQKPVMMYVFSDGSVFSNGMTDDSIGGRGKGVWTGDNQQTASAFFLVYNPTQKPQIIGATEDEQARNQQIGFMRASGDVETSSSPAANNVNSLVESVVLNYMALHGEQGNFGSIFEKHGLGNLDAMTAFQPLG
ncbi:general secretion pathway protein GspF [Marinagarivorans cellulosilyticus]|uniref:General secretion pathway protein GspF n=1 Tax=Marinagarivorans cellulosilyticus TaxID=2721545 RepID=A0AAN2BJA2_9GAMM|nr:general secretion pathway protein GspF [Marinagarivorans cellulosilyticus]BCD96739.1 hypothetical protein MARGE09_P0939 [Marinagarivorans cellulosilyticus]